MEYAKTINTNMLSTICNSLEALNDRRDDNHKVVIGIVITKHYLFSNGFCFVTICMNTIKIINNINISMKNNHNDNVIVIIPGDIKSSGFHIDISDQCCLLYRSFLARKVFTIMIINITGSSTIQIVFGIYHLLLNRAYWKITLYAIIIGNGNNIDSNGDIKSKDKIGNSLEVLNNGKDNNNKAVIGIVTTLYYLFPNGFCLVTMCINNRINIINNINNNVNVIIVGDIKSVGFHIDVSDQRCLLYQSLLARKVFTIITFSNIDSSTIQIVFGIYHLFLNGVYLKIMLCAIVIGNRNNIDNNFYQNNLIKMYFSVFKIIQIHVILEILILIEMEILNPR